MICSNKGGDGITAPYGATNVRSFTVSLPHYGTDPKWKMWSQDVGNGMTAMVNEATGNMVLDTKLESAGSPLGPLSVSLSYNSQQSNYFGLGKGWDLAIGEESSGFDLPIRVKKLGAESGSSLEVTFRGGTVKIYPKKDQGHVWGGVGTEEGTISESLDGESPRFTWRVGDGGIYTFDKDGNILQARPRATAEDTSDKYYFGYQFAAVADGSKRLQTVTDPLGHKVTLNWNTSTARTALTSITTWNNNQATPSATAYNTYRFTYYPDDDPDLARRGLLKEIAIPDPLGDGDPAAAPATATLKFDYANGLLYRVANATQTLDGSDGTTKGWEFGYQQYTGDPSSSYRVMKIIPPAQGVTPQPWLINYVGPFTGASQADGGRSAVAATAYVCDPRSGFTAASSCISSRGRLPANSTQLDFNNAGLLIRIYGPSDNEGYAATTAMLWDSNNNILCSRSTAANAKNLKSSLTTADGDDCRTDARNTVYAYQTDAPFRQLSVLYPNPGDTAGANRDVDGNGTVNDADRGSKTFSYDTGADFTGLWVEGFDNQRAAGLTLFERISTSGAFSFSEDWPSGKPSEFQGQVGDNGYAIHWSGHLDLSGRSGDSDRYAFKVAADQPVTLSVDGKTLFDCANRVRLGQDFSINCGTLQSPGEVAHKTLKNKLVEIDVVYTHAPGTGDPGITLRWDHGTNEGDWQILGQGSNPLQANLGLLTKTVENDQKKITYTYLSNDSKRRKLADQVDVTAINAGVGGTRSTKYADYDVYGNVTKQINAYQSGMEQVALNYYTTAPDGNDPSTYRPCQVQANDPIQSAGIKLNPPIDDAQGLATDFTCDDVGNIIEVSKKVVPGTAQTAENRVTTTDYDRGNRVVEVKTYKEVGTARTLVGWSRKTYLADGRVASEKTLLDDSDPANEVWATTNYAYGYTPRGPAMTVTAESPTGTGTISSTTQFDWAGNKIWVTDPRNTTLGTCTYYDALNRPVMTVAGATVDSGVWPYCSGGVASVTRYILSNAGVYDHRTVTTSPAVRVGSYGTVTGVDSTVWLDMLDRKIQERSEDRPVTTYTLDIWGNVVEMSTPLPNAGTGTTTVKTTSTYNVFGQVLTETKFDNDAASKATTTYHYNDAGLLEWVDPPRDNVTDKNDKITYAYDGDGRLTSATYDGLFIPYVDGGTSGTKASTRFTYNAMGEKLKVETPLTAAHNGTAGVTMTRSWTYDAMGRQTSFTDGRGQSTTSTYDKGGRLIQTTVPDAGGSPPNSRSGVDYRYLKYTYNKAGKQTSRYATDAAGAAVGNKECSIYDASGNPATAYVMSGNANCDIGNAVPAETITATYDDLNRLKDVTVGTETSPSTTFDYVDPAEVADPDYPVASFGKVKSVTDPAGVTAFTYYPDDTGTAGAAEGMLKTLDDPLATTGRTTYSYDAAGRLTGRTDPAGMTWAISFEDTTGRFDKETITQSYGSPAKLLASFDPTFDKAGNVKTMVESVLKSTGPDMLNSDSGTWTYAYDEANRLTSSVQTGGPGTNRSFAYAYDGGGNRISSKDPQGATTTTVYDASGLPIAETTGGVAKTYCYDVVGELSAKGPNGCGASKDLSYSYDPWGRLTQAVKGTTTVDYTLDALGRTTSRAQTGGDNPGTTTYSLRGTSELIATAAFGGQTTSYAYTSSGTPLAQRVGTDTANTRFFLKNPHGDVVSTVNAPGADQSGVPKWSGGYSPYGERESENAETGMDAPRLGFQGQPWDPTTGLVDANARMYDPSMGRFTTMDSVFGDMKYPTSLNQYVYGGDNPATMSDPSGMWSTASYWSSSWYWSWLSSYVAIYKFIPVAKPSPPTPVASPGPAPQPPEPPEAANPSPETKKTPPTLDQLQARLWQASANSQWERAHDIAGRMGHLYGPSVGYEALGSLIRVTASAGSHSNDSKSPWNWVNLVEGMNDRRWQIATGVNGVSCTAGLVVPGLCTGVTGVVAAMKEASSISKVAKGEITRKQFVGDTAWNVSGAALGWKSRVVSGFFGGLDLVCTFSGCSNPGLPGNTDPVPGAGFGGTGGGAW